MADSADQQRHGFRNSCNMCLLTHSSPHSKKMHAKQHVSAKQMYGIQFLVKIVPWRYTPTCHLHPRSYEWCDICRQRVGTIPSPLQKCCAGDNISLECCDVTCSPTFLSPLATHPQLYFIVIVDTSTQWMVDMCDMKAYWIGVTNFYKHTPSASGRWKDRTVSCHIGIQDTEHTPMTVR